MLNPYPTEAAIAQVEGSFWQELQIDIAWFEEYFSDDYRTGCRH